MDRLDYLKRDSFFTGVSEGVVSNQRIIKMFAVSNDEIVVREKGIYSIEKFLIARRLMYWQVYLHKTVLSAEFLLEKIINRARQLIQSGEKLFAPETIYLFLSKNIEGQLLAQSSNLNSFSMLDDYDVFACIKVWCNSNDKVISTLCNMLINRRLPKVKISNMPFREEEINDLRIKHRKKLGFNEDELSYFIYQKEMQNNAYDSAKDEIKILFKDGSLKDITDASDNLNISALSNPVKKYYLFSPSF
jgi:HD superfamily phosphohydrolase